MKEQLQLPDYLFECSWEVCNKIGGIYTVLSTKAQTLKQVMGNGHIVIGPDFWKNEVPNPDFLEDKKLFQEWKEELHHKGLNIRIGRWNVIGEPIAILVDFKPLIKDKDKIFTKFWELYKLDSLHGHQEYIDSAIFGVAAGKVVESFKNKYCKSGQKVAAHFHEWMTGSGILYLKWAAPDIATIFTTHATFVGRSICGNGQPLYDPLESYNGLQKATEFNIQSQYSIERLSAMYADAFTTVSDITARECRYLLDKPVDFVTPNGFEDDFVPQKATYTRQRNAARKRLTEIAEAMMGEKLPDDTIFVGTSGRYEFKNKGMDVFIDALKKANDSQKVKKRIIAFILTPANSGEARIDLVNSLETLRKKNKFVGIEEPTHTHNLHQKQYDPIINRMQGTSIAKVDNTPINLIFIPAYLNGNDGILNLHYYKALIGMDLTVFPSYYEPWGYTPLESVAFAVPTVTTSLAGFGVWINDQVKNILDGAVVLNRNDHNYDKVVSDLSDVFIHFSELTNEERKHANTQAQKLAQLATWESLIGEYYNTYDFALTKMQKRSTKLINETKPIEMDINASNLNSPIWKDVTVQPKISKELKGLEEIANNLWYVWNYQAGDLFEKIDPELWATYHNPIITLERISATRYEQLIDDKDFMKEYKSVYASFKAYMTEAPDPKSPSISYFSMEYGLTEILKIYSGGLGVLAGDYLKEASDCNVRMSAVGLLYTYGYFTQTLSVYGEQEAVYDAQNFASLPVSQVLDASGAPIKYTIPFPGREVAIRVWKVAVGRIDLFLLDTNFEDNNNDDRFITHQLYGGNWENRLKQEIVLGIGGIKALDILGVKNEVYHCNEGHAAFINLARMDHYINEEGLSYKEALEVVRASSLYTTHTPVPAGHDAFDEGLLGTYMGAYPGKLKISWDDFMALGHQDNFNHHEKFSMSNLAAKTSQEINGVSWLHGKVSQEMFKGLWKGYFAEELALSYVTNGVHYGTWTSSDWRRLYESNFDANFLKDLSNHDIWRQIHKIEDKTVWETKVKLKEKLIDYIRFRFKKDWLAKQGDPSRVLQLLQGIRSDVLTIGFGRRFATYKRAHLLFNDLERLSKIVNNPDRPVQFLFTGKAHPADGGGQGLIKHVVEISRRPEFLGKIIFLENYDMRLAQRLIPGVDIWLNTPTRPLEASGTSGQKAELNGTLNLSVLDGWWLEGYVEGAGWAITDKRTYENQEHQDELDAETIYSLLENEITPAYYTKDKSGVSKTWVKFIKNSISEIAPKFTTKRMLDDYLSKFYIKQYKRTLELKADNYKLAKDLTTWKEHVATLWDQITVISTDLPSANNNLGTGDDWTASVVLDLKGLKSNEVGIEIVQLGFDENDQSYLRDVITLKASKEEGSLVTFETASNFENAGHYKIGIRMFPNHDALPHRQDFAMVRWI